jgi:hypothetical protein
MRAFLLLTLTIVLSAATLDGVNVGSPVHGPKIAPTDLEGRVVIFEYWGVNCPPCVANIPHMAELAAIDPERERLVIIANHCQQPGRTKEVWLAKGGGDHIAVIEGGELSGANVSGIPHVFVFDGSGKQVFDGHPGQLTVAQVTAWLDTANGPVVGKGPFTAVAKQAKAINERKGPIGPDVASVRKLAAKDGPAQSEASAVLTKTEDWIAKQAARCTTLKDEDPSAAFTLATRMAGLLKGDESAKAFEDLVKEWRKDKAMVRELQAGQFLAEIVAQADKIGLSKGDPEARQRKQAMTQISEGLAAITKRFADTKAAATAQALASEWRL